MLTKLVIIILCVLGICVSLLDIYRTYVEPLKERIKNLYEENDSLIETNYKLGRKTDRQKNLIESQEKIICDLSEEVQTYRNSFNNN